MPPVLGHRRHDSLPDFSGKLIKLPDIQAFQVSGSGDLGQKRNWTWRRTHDFLFIIDRNTETGEKEAVFKTNPSGPVFKNGSVYGQSFNF
jgi:hypothetical protein